MLKKKSEMAKDEPPGNPLIFYSAIQNKFKIKNKTQEGGTYLLGSPP